MKTIVLIISILVSTLFSSTLFAGDKNELKLSYGASPFDFKFKNYLTSYGTLSLSYNRKIHKRISVGIQLNSAIKEIGIDEETKIAPLISPYLKFDYRYIVRSNFELYSSAMIGIPVQVLGIYGIIPLPFPFPHLTLLGFKRGDIHAIFGELGIGLGQMVTAGYAYKF